MDICIFYLYWTPTAVYHPLLLNRSATATINQSSCITPAESIRLDMSIAVMGHIGIGMSSRVNQTYIPQAILG